MLSAAALFSALAVGESVAAPLLLLLIFLVGAFLHKLATLDTVVTLPGDITAEEAVAENARRFRALLTEAAISRPLAEAIRDWSDEHHPEGPQQVLLRREAFELFVADYVASLPSDPDERTSRLAELRKLRDDLDLFPHDDEHLISSRELEEEATIEVDVAHPDSDDEPPSFKAKVLRADDDRLDLEPADKLEDEQRARLSRGDALWIAIDRGDKRYLFEAAPELHDDDRISLAHGGFLIRA